MADTLGRADISRAGGCDGVRRVLDSRFRGNDGAERGSDMPETVNDAAETENCGAVCVHFSLMPALIGDRCRLFGFHFGDDAVYAPLLQLHLASVAAEAEH